MEKALITCFQSTDSSHVTLGQGDGNLTNFLVRCFFEMLHFSFQCVDSFLHCFHLVSIGIPCWLLCRGASDTVQQVGTSLLEELVCKPYSLGVNLQVAFTAKLDKSVKIEPDERRVSNKVREPGSMDSRTPSKREKTQHSLSNERCKLAVVEIFRQHFILKAFLV